jgi:hypothetical protein
MAPRVALAAALLVLNAAAAAAAAARPAAPAPPSLRFNNLAPAHEAPRDEDAELELLQFPPLALLNNGEGGGDHTDPDAVTPNEDADLEYCCRTCKERIRVRSALRSTRSVPRLRPSTVRCLVLVCLDTLRYWAHGTLRYWAHGFYSLLPRPEQRRIITAPAPGPSYGMSKQAQMLRTIGHRRDAPQAMRRTIGPPTIFRRGS